MTILVADDNLASRELMREVLEASGLGVVEVTNRREALDLHRHPPVFLDLQMPVPRRFLPPTAQPTVSAVWPIWGTV